MLKNIIPKEKQMHSLIFDFLMAFVSISILLFCRLRFGMNAEILYIVVWGVFLLWFGHVHPIRQTFVGIIFLSLFWGSNFIFPIKSQYFILLLETVYIVAINININITISSKRIVHKNMNEDYLKRKQSYQNIKNDRKKFHKIINQKQADIRMMLSLYDITKKIVASITLDDIVKLCINFFDKNFVLNNYIIFKYDYKDKEYSFLSLFNVDDIGWEKLKYVFKNLMWPSHYDDKKFNYNEDSIEWNRMMHAIPNGVRSFILQKVMTSGDIVYGAILFSKEKNYFQDVILKYLDILSGQIGLGIEKVALYEEVREKSRRDELTGLFTRLYFDERLEIEIKRVSRYQEKFSLLMMDVDYFKKYNDKYGHLIGDMVLKHITSTIKDCVRSSDVIARYGGEEFIVLLPMATREEALLKAEEICKAVVRQPILNIDHITGLKDEVNSISIGLACWTEDATEKESLIAKADQALYAAKNNGRNQVVDYAEISNNILSQEENLIK